MKSRAPRDRVPEESFERLQSEASELAFQAFLARKANDLDKAVALTRRAYTSQADAAASLADSPDREPERAMAFRSAALLAIDAGELAAAEQLLDGVLESHRLGELREEAIRLRDEVRRRRGRAARPSGAGSA